MTDFESFQEAIDADEEEYMGPFNRSLSLAMDEFYSNIRCAGVSAVTGEGIESLFSQIGEAAVEFNEVYLPELQRKMDQKKERDSLSQEATIRKIQEDIKSSGGDVEIRKSDVSGSGGQR